MSVNVPVLVMVVAVPDPTLAPVDPPAWSVSSVPISVAKVLSAVIKSPVLGLVTLSTEIFPSSAA